MEMFMKITVLTAMFGLIAGMSFAGKGSAEEVAVIKTDKGDIVVKFYPEAAPKHVENFIKLAESGFYNGLTFHRVIPGFVIQGGDPTASGAGGPSEADLKKAYDGKIPDWIRKDPSGYTLPAEIKEKHTDGALAMARTNNPEKRSSTSQFYICLGPQPHLDDGYTVFGQVITGMDVANKIQKGDKIISVTVEKR